MLSTKYFCVPQPLLLLFHLLHDLKERGTLLETGKNTLQKTLLLRREAEVDKIQYELEKKKIDFDKRMEECRLKKEDLKLKQKVVVRLCHYFYFMRLNFSRRTTWIKNSVSFSCHISRVNLT